MITNPRMNMSVTEQIMDKCRHFTGIQHGICKKGVAYVDVRDSSTSPYRWPCLKSDHAHTTCEAFEPVTREEAEKEAKEWDDHWQQIKQDLAEGRCPHCHQGVTKRQVGPCVYGSCGHRLYQGKI